MPRARIEGYRWMNGELEKSNPIAVIWRDPAIDRKGVVEESLYCASTFRCGGFRNRLILPGSAVMFVADSGELDPLSSVFVYCLKCYAHLPDRFHLLRVKLNAWERESITTISGFPLDTSL